MSDDFLDLDSGRVLIRSTGIVIGAVEILTGRMIRPEELIKAAFGVGKLPDTLGLEGSPVQNELFEAFTEPDGLRQRKALKAWLLMIAEKL